MSLYDHIKAAYYTICALSVYTYNERTICAAHYTWPIILYIYIKWTICGPNVTPPNPAVCFHGFASRALPGLPSWIHCCLARAWGRVTAGARVRAEPSHPHGSRGGCSFPIGAFPRPQNTEAISPPRFPCSLLEQAYKLSPWPKNKKKQGGGGKSLIS